MRRIAIAAVAILILEYALLYYLKLNFSLYIGILLHHIAMVIFISALMAESVSSKLIGYSSFLAAIMGIITVGIALWSHPDTISVIGFSFCSGMLSVTVYLYCIVFIGAVIWGDKFGPQTVKTT